MARGARIRHRTIDRTGIYLVVEPRPYGAPLWCSTCEDFHKFKTHHLRLQGGVTIVSETVWERLQVLGGHGLVFENWVRKPPPIKIGDVPQMLIDGKPQPDRIIGARRLEE